MIVLLMLLVQPPFTRKLEIPSRKSASVEFVASTWEMEVETQGGEQTPPPACFIPLCHHHGIMGVAEGGRAPLGILRVPVAG